MSKKDKKKKPLKCDEKKARLDQIWTNINLLREEIGQLFAALEKLTETMHPPQPPLELRGMNEIQDEMHRRALGDKLELRTVEEIQDEISTI